MVQDANVFVLSLGGSLIVPNGGIDVDFLTQFHDFIRDQVSSKKRRFFITVGGGAITRHYQAAARAVRQRLEGVGPGFEPRRHVRQRCRRADNAG